MSPEKVNKYYREKIAVVLDTIKIMEFPKREVALIKPYMLL